MQKRLLKSAYSNLSAAVDVLEEVKTADIRARKHAKASAKSKWTKRIDATTDAMFEVKTARKIVRAMPKRVA